MPIITGARIAALAPHVNPDIADQLATALETGMPQFGITGLLPRAHFMAQACYESEGFTRFEENLDYTHADVIARVWPRLASRAESLVNNPVALGNAAYAFENGNGNEASGDGFRYKGRGLIQITGRSAYEAASKNIHVPLVGNPDLAAQPQYAVLTALNYWRVNKCSIPAALNDVAGVTRLINGRAMEGLAQRAALTEQAIKIFT